MPSYDFTKHLNDNQTQCLFGVQSFTPGTYTARLDARSGAGGLYSSLFVKSVTPGTTVDVEYYEFTTGADHGEKNLFEVRPTIDDTFSFPYTDNACIPKFHLNVITIITVSGGTAEMGLMQSPRNILGPLTKDADGEDCLNVCAVFPGLGEAGKIDLIPVSAAAWTVVLVAPMTGRRAVGLQNTDGAGGTNPDPVLQNYAPFAPAGANVGWRIAPGESKFYDAEAGLIFYLRVAPGGGSFNVVFEQVK